MIWQGRAGRDHIGEISVTLVRGDLHGGEHRPLGWHILVGHVRVPDKLTISEVANWLACLIEDIGDDVQLRKGRKQCPAIRIRTRRVELAKLSGKLQKA